MLSALGICEMDKEMALNCALSKRAEQRRKELDQYLSANVLARKFICKHYRSCRDSYSDTFYEGELHHIGRFYDLETNGVPLRIVIVGQEYGHPPARVSSLDRYKMVMGSAYDSTIPCGQWLFGPKSPYEGNNKCPSPHIWVATRH